MKQKRTTPFFAPLQRRIHHGLAHMEYATINLVGPGGTAQLFLQPPKFSIFPSQSMLSINGMYRMPLDSMQAMLVECFMQELKKACPQGEEISLEDIAGVEERAIKRTGRLYGNYSEEHRRGELHFIMHVVLCFALNQPLPEGVNFGIDMNTWRKIARAPDRMDLILTSLEKDGHRIDPLDCMGCYARCPAMNFTSGEELTTEQWEQVIAKLYKIGVPQITFTGGEPTVHPDLVRLIGGAARWALTRLNTSGVTMTKKLAHELREAELGVVQMTLYDSNDEIHDQLVGRTGAHQYTVRGIRNALEEMLSTSVNVPLCRLNAGHFVETLAFLKRLGVVYVSCSGLIPTGGAVEMTEEGLELTHDELYTTLLAGKEFADREGIELSYTSPGQISEDEAHAIGFADVPVCGACLTNMAIMPNGAVVLCQSNMDKHGLGNFLTTPWSRIWNNPVCKRIRDTVALTNSCALAER
jgi:MoaA/NifB/PqqE/SkfB family radical SAM enzyme